MKRHRTLRRQLQSHGDFPDAGWGSGPDSRTALRALSSGMSPLIETARATADVEAEIVIVGTRASLCAAPTGWRPAINAYRCEDRFLVYVDLAGVPPASVEVVAQPGRLVLKGTRPAPEPSGPDAHLCQLLALEIDHGTFERVLELPPTVDAGDISTEYRDGLFQITLGLKS
jgi:HSP20 family protein